MRLRLTIFIEPEERWVSFAAWIKQHRLFAFQVIWATFAKRGANTVRPKRKVVVLATCGAMLSVDSLAVTERTAVTKVVPGKCEPPVSPMSITLGNGVLGAIMVHWPIRTAII